MQPESMAASAIHPDERHIFELATSGTELLLHERDIPRSLVSFVRDPKSSERLLDPPFRSDDHGSRTDPSQDAPAGGNSLHADTKRYGNLSNGICALRKEDGCRSLAKPGPIDRSLYRGRIVRRSIADRSVCGHVEHSKGTLLADHGHRGVEPDGRSFVRNEGVRYRARRSPGLTSTIDQFLNPRRSPSRGGDRPPALREVWRALGRDLWVQGGASWIGCLHTSEQADAA